MNELQLFAPGGATIRVVVSMLVQSTLVVLAAAILSRAALRRDAPARHALWLGVLLWVLMSPAIGVVANHVPVLFEAAVFRIPDGAADEVAPSDRPAVAESADSDTPDQELSGAPAAPAPTAEPTLVLHAGSGRTIRASSPARVPLSVRLAGGGVGCGDAARPDSPGRRRPPSGALAPRSAAA